MALWIGGAPGAGKTTIARLLARRHGLRWYNADAHTWKHRDRAIAAGHAEAIRWERLSVTERWTAPVDDMFAMSLHDDRGSMIADDVAALPASPLTIAEGTAVVPGIVRPNDPAVWLLSSAKVQEERLLERGMDRDSGAFTLYQALLYRIREHLAAYAVTILNTDDHGIDEVLSKVEELFADALADGPKASTDLERGALLRYANRATVTQHHGFFARPWAPPDSGRTYGFACECGRVTCAEEIVLPVAAFPSPPDDGSRPVLAPGHPASV